jgi:hypothetical protein
MMGKKGIGEIVAALILISIVVAASIIIYVYSSGLLGSLQGARPQQPYTNQLTLEYYDWTTNTNCGPGKDSTLQTLCLTLRNAGSGFAVLADFFVAGVKVTAPIKGSCAAYTAKSLLPQSASGGTQSSCTAVLVIANPTIVNGVAYSVRVVTVDGSVFSYSCIAGQRTGSLS